MRATHDARGFPYSMTPAEYQARLDAGERHCLGCTAWHAIDAFDPDPSSASGVKLHCRESSLPGSARRRGARKPDAAAPEPASERRPWIVVKTTGVQYFLHCTRCDAWSAAAATRAAVERDGHDFELLHSLCEEREP